MRFFQVKVTNEYKTTLDRMYIYVYNYASLAEAMKTLRAAENKDAVDGYTFTDNLTKRKVVQYHLSYEENGGAVIELRQEFFGIPEDCSVEQVVSIQSVYLHEIVL